MADTPESDQKTEAPTPKRLREAIEKGDVLQSRELGTALIILAGAAWLIAAGPMTMGALETMITDGLSFSAADVREFDPVGAMLKLIGIVVLPVAILFALTFVAAVATPAMLGSLGFRAEAFRVNPGKSNPLSGFKRIFGMQGVIELVKSLAKVILIGSVGVWLLMSRGRALVGLGARNLHAAIGDIGSTFIIAVLVMGVALAAVALIDVPAQFMQRSKRLRMSKEEVKEEHKQTEGSPEAKAAQRRKQREIARSSVRSAVEGATVILTNPTHFAVALRYRQGEDPAPIVVAKGRGATAEAIRELAKELDVPMLSYPQLTRAIYYTSRVGQLVRDDLYLAVATVLAFVFQLDAAVGAVRPQPAVNVPPGARFDARGRPEG